MTMTGIERPPRDRNRLFKQDAPEVLRALGGAAGAV